MNVFRLQVVVVTKSAKPLTTIESKISIESWFAVKIKLNSLVALLDVILVRGISGSKLELIDTCKFLIVIDRKSVFV